MSTLNFAITNKAQKDNSYTVYLRYFFKNQYGKKKLKHFPTSFSLNKSDFQKLKNGKLGGNVNKELQKEKRTLQTIIDDIQSEKQGIDATEDEIINRLRANKVTLQSLEYYFNLLLDDNQIRAKSTIQAYRAIFNRFRDWLYLQRDYINVKSLNQNIFDRYVNYLFTVFESEYSINNNARKIKSLINYIFQKIEKNETISYKSISIKKNEIYLYESEINKLVNYSTNNRVLQEMQLYISLNRYIGLRRSELIHLKNENIIHHKNYSTLKFWESKKHQYRTITIVNNEVIKLLKKHQTSNEYFFNLHLINYNNINKILKQLAKVCNLNRNIEQFKISNKKRIIEQKHLYDAIHTHQIRAFAIQYNLMKYGSLIAKTYSGHTSITMIEKHYSHQLNEQEQLQILKEKNI